MHYVLEVEKRQPLEEDSVSENARRMPIASVQGRGVFVMDSVDGAVLDLVRHHFVVLHFLWLLVVQFLVFQFLDMFSICELQPN
jgi:hypothetical protein